MKKILLFISIVVLNYQFSIAQLTTNYKVVGYVYKESYPINIDYQHFTHAMFAFLNIDTLGNVLPFESHTINNFNRFLSQSSKNKNLKRYISLNPSINVIAKDEEKIKYFAKNLIKFLKKHKMQGADMDWEMLLHQTDSKRYTRLMKILSEKLHKENLELVATVTYGDWFGKWFEMEALNVADWVQIMVYDRRGAWSGSEIGNHSSFEHVLEAEKYWVDRGLVKEKMVIGLPFYGHHFPYQGDMVKGDDFKKVYWMSYDEIVKKYPNLSDTTNQIVENDGIIFFNGPALIKKKCEYIIQNNFGGVMIWELSQDITGNNSLYKHISQTFNNQSTTNINNQIIDNESITIFQNQETINLSFNQKEINQSLLIKIYNTKGKLCYTKNIIPTTTKIDEKINLSEGLYTVIIETQEHIYSKKIILE